MQRRTLLKNLGAATLLGYTGAEKRDLAKAQAASMKQDDHLGHFITPVPPSGLPELVARDEIYWEKVRQLFVLNASAVPMSNGYGGLTPQQILDRLADLVSDEAHFKSLLFIGRQESGPSRPLSELMAADFGASPEEITLTRNATEGLATLLFGLDLRRGDEVLTTNQDYGGCLSILRQREKRDGIRFNLITLPLPSISEQDIVQRLEAAITPQTRVLLISHIFCYSGEVMPIASICRMARKHGLFTIIDGAHGPGHVRLNLHEMGCDAYAASLHKWFMAPRGTGLLYIRKERIADVYPLFYWDRGVPTDSITKFEAYGTVNLAVPAVLPMVFAFNRTITYPNKEARLRYLREHWTKQLAAIPGVHLCTNQSPEFACAMTAFRIEGADTEKLFFQLLRKYHVRANFSANDPDLKFDCLNGAASLVNSLADCDRLVNAVADAIKTRDQNVFG